MDRQLNPAGSVENDLGCVETPAREERAELLSQLSYLDAVGQRFCLSN
jgi:hypothetical protein